MADVVNTDQQVQEQGPLQEVRVDPLTKAVCTKCGREDAPVLYLKRSHGRYDLLCRMSDGSGCYPQSGRTLCQYTGADMAQCFQLAEWLVRPGGTAGDTTYRTCSDHVGKVLGDRSINSIYPID